MKCRFCISLCLAILLAVSGCTSPQYGNGERLLPSETDLEEIRVGRDIHREILSRVSPYQNEEVALYVNGVADVLSQYASRQELVYRVTVLIDEQCYATSAPGGFIYITTGMLQFLENEAELAAVLAHEVARVQYRAQQEQETRKFFKDVSQATMTVSPFFGAYGMLAGFFMQGVGWLFSIGPSIQAHVLRADALAINYMVES